MIKIIDSEKYERLLDQLAKEISANNNLEDLVFIGIKRKGDILAERLNTRLDTKIPIGAIKINLYRDDLQANNADAIIQDIDIPFSLKDKNVIIVDDVLYTGRTIRVAINALLSQAERPKSIKLAVLVDRGGRELPFYADYIGHSIDLEGTNKYIYVKITTIDDENAVYVLEDQH